MTTIESGTLALTNSGSIANSSNINISAGATLDVSTRTGDGMTLASGKQISGVGSVKGNFTVGNGAKLTPGNSIGTLTFSNALTLVGGSASIFEISKRPLVCDVAVVLGTLTFGGSLTVIKMDTNALMAGDSFRFFNAPGYSGAFDSVVLPASGPTLTWDRSGLGTSGLVKVVAVSVPRIGKIALLDAIVVMSGTGGAPNTTYQVMISTNLSAPRSNWTRLATNQFDAAGNFSFTNSIQTGAAERYFLLQVP